MAKEKLYVTEFNCETGVQIDREFTEEEYAAHAKSLADHAKAVAEREEQERIKAEAKTAALAKLAAIGLSAEDIQAIVG